MKKNVLTVTKIIAALACILLCGCLMRTTTSLQSQNNSLVSENERLQSEVDTLSGKCDINNCPLCDSENVELIHKYSWGYQVMCHDCYLSIWYYPTASEAIETWNSLTKEEPLPSTMMMTKGE